MWKVSPKIPHTKLLCRVQFHNLPLKTIMRNNIQAKMDFLNFFGLNTLNFPYISEELTDKYHLRKSIFTCTIKNSVPQTVCSQKKILCREECLNTTNIPNLKF